MLIIHLPHTRGLASEREREKVRAVPQSWWKRHQPKRTLRTGRSTGGSVLTKCLVLLNTCRWSRRSTKDGTNPSAKRRPSGQQARATSTSKLWDPRISNQVREPNSVCRLAKVSLFLWDGHQYRRPHLPSLVGSCVLRSRGFSR